jgi:hypothetical protein
VRLLWRWGAVSGARTDDVALTALGLCPAGDVEKRYCDLENLPNILLSIRHQMVPVSRVSAARNRFSCPKTESFHGRPGPNRQGPSNCVTKEKFWLAFREAHPEIGQRVGIGWSSYSCLSCHECLSGEHNLCAHSRGTIVGRHRWICRPLARAVDLGSVFTRCARPREDRAAPLWRRHGLRSVPEIGSEGVDFTSPFVGELQRHMTEAANANDAYSCRW